jgi:hypothetical protein
LVVLGHARPYDNQVGEGGRLILIPSRFRTLGEKRNAGAALASPEAGGGVVADDDICLLHWFSTQAGITRRVGLGLLETPAALHQTNPVRRRSNWNRARPLRRWPAPAPTTASRQPRCSRPPWP